jgi:hypothetical protein
LIHQPGEMVHVCWERGDTIEKPRTDRQGGEVAGQPVLGWQIQAKFALGEASGHPTQAYPRAPDPSTRQERGPIDLLYHRVARESSENGLVMDACVEVLWNGAARSRLFVLHPGRAVCYRRFRV